MTSAPQLGIESVGQILVNVKDLPRAVAFYRDTLGLPFLFEVPGMAFFSCGAVRLLLGPAQRPEHDHASSILYYRVADIAAAHRLLVARSVPCEEEPAAVHRAAGKELWLAFYRDSEQNIFALMSEVPIPAGSTAG